jgi:hypothetical protein
MNKGQNEPWYWTQKEIEDVWWIMDMNERNAPLHSLFWPLDEACVRL